MFVFESLVADYLREVYGESAHEFRRDVLLEFILWLRTGERMMPSIKPLSLNEFSILRIGRDRIIVRNPNAPRIEEPADFRFHQGGWSVFDFNCFEVIGRVTITENQSEPNLNDLLEQIKRTSERVVVICNKCEEQSNLASALAAKAEGHVCNRSLSDNTNCTRTLMRLDEWKKLFDN